MVLCVGRVPLVAVWLKPSCRWLAPSSGWPLETVGAWREEGEREARWEGKEREAERVGRAGRDAVFGGRFATGETPRSTTSASEADEGDGAGGDGGTGFDLFGPDPTPMEDL